MNRANDETVVAEAIRCKDLATKKAIADNAEKVLKLRIIPQEE